MRHLFHMTRRELQCAAAGIVITLLIGVPVVAVASPGAIPGSGPGDRVDPGAEQAVAASRGDSCRNLLPADTPDFVVCRWLTPPQDAAEVAAFWGADGGANLEAARPLPAQYVRCNQKTDLSKVSACKGGETLCKELTGGWYECKNLATGQITYERYQGGKKVVSTTPPPVPDASPSTARPASASPTAAAAMPTLDANDAPGTGEEGELPPEGNPSETAPTSAPTPGLTPSAASTVTGEPTQAPGKAPTSEPATPSPGGGAVAQAIAAAQAARLRIWIESDLADDYQAGDAQFQAALQALITAAQQPGVLGVKFADNLGYSGFTSAREVTTFLSRATSALRTALPGKRLAIGVVVPELGCGSSTTCVQAMRGKAPLVTKQLVDRYLKAAGVDRVEISTGLFGHALAQHQVTDPATRKPAAITPALATRAQWLSIKALGWDTLTQLSSREYGLTHEGGTAGWDKRTATAQINARVGTVIGLGVPTVTLWGHQADDGDRTYRLLDPGLAANPVWTALTGLRARLAVMFDPRSVDVGVWQDIAALAKGVSEIFILA